jgi:hypothetical protein
VPSRRWGAASPTAGVSASSTHSRARAERFRLAMRRVRRAAAPLPLSGHRPPCTTVGPFSHTG